MKQQLSKINKFISRQTKTTNRLTALVVVLLVVAIGTYLLISSHAQVPFISLTASSGSTSGGATSQACAGTSGSTCVVFNGTSGGGGGGSTTMTNCLQIPGPLANGYDNPLQTNNYPIFSDLDACGYPSPDTAGVPSSLSLTTISSSNAPANTTWNGSDLDITGPATVSGYYIPGYVVLNSSNITLKDDQVKCISCTSASGAGSIIVNQGGTGNEIEYTTVEGANTSSIGGTNSAGTDCTGPSSADIGNITTSQTASDIVTIDHDVLTCSVEVANVNGGLVGLKITNSYLMMDGYTSTSHNEDIFAGAHTSNDIEDNTLLCPISCTAVIFGASYSAGAGSEGTNTIKDNLMAGGGYGDGTITGGGSLVDVLDNRFSGTYGSLAAGAVCPDTSWSGNYSDSALSNISGPFGCPPGDCPEC